MIALLALLTLAKPVALLAQETKNLNDLSYAELKAAISKEVKTLERDINVYHYATRSNGPGKMHEEVIPIFDADGKGGMNGAVPFQSQVYQEYFKALTTQYEDNSGTEWHFGKGGMYAAIDPVQSGDYAGIPPVLLEITIKAGARYLNQREYPPSDNLNVSGSYITQKIRDQDPQVKKILKELNIIFISFPWRVSAFSMCAESVLTTRPDFRLAVWLMNPSALDNLIKIRGYSPIINYQTMPENQLRHYQYLASAFDFYFRHSYGMFEDALFHSHGSWIRGQRIQFQDQLSTQFKNFSARPMIEDSKLEQMMRVKTLGCHPDFVKEEL